MPKPKVNKKVYLNNTQKKIGAASEDKFFAFYKKEGFVFGDGRKVDFININTKETVELKSDTREIEETGNLFIEEISNVNKETKGGIFRAFDHKIDYFCYYFIPSRKILWFKVNDFYKFINKNLGKFKSKTIFNRGYDTLGRLIPYEDCKFLVIREDKI